MALELPQGLISTEMSLFDLSGGSLEDTTCKAVFISPDSELSTESLFTGSIFQKHLDGIV